MVDDAILDERIALGFRGGPTFSTDKLGMVGGQERRFQNRSIAIHNYTWEYKNQTRDIIAGLRAFFYDRRGDFKTWLLKDWSDFRGTAEAIGVANGVLTQFQIIKTYTGGFNPYERTIRHIKTGTLKVYLDGVLQDNSGSPATYTESNGLITFSSAPAAAIVTVDYEFYVPVRFEGDAFVSVVDYPEEIDAMTVGTLNAIEVVP